MAAEPARHSSLVERLRAVHLEMVDAVLGGDGLGRVAQLAADAAGGTVAIVVPRLGAAVLSPGGTTSDLGLLRRYVGARAKDRPSPVPEDVLAVVVMRIWPLWRRGAVPASSGA